MNQFIFNIGMFIIAGMVITTFVMTFFGIDYRLKLVPILETFFVTFILWLIWLFLSVWIFIFASK